MFSWTQTPLEQEGSHDAMKRGHKREEGVIYIRIGYIGIHVGMAIGEL